MPDRVYSLVFVDVAKPGFFCEHNRDKSELQELCDIVVDTFNTKVLYYPRTIMHCMNVEPSNSVKEVLELYPEAYGIQVVILPG